MSALDPVIFRSCFINWIQSFQLALKEVIAIDGKCLCKSFDKATESSAIHMVSAFATSTKLVLGQEKVGNKSNEITAIPKLLDLLFIEGAIVSLDAMGAQRSIAEKIRDEKADYVLALKGNQTSWLLNIPSLVVRGIGNVFENDSTQSNIETANNELASENAAKFVVSLIRNQSII